MFNPFGKRLSKEEVAKTLKKIRKEYNNYIVSYMKSSRAKEEFENRYFFAAKYKENMANFFKNEIILLNQLVAQEEEKLAQRKEEKKLAEQRRDRQQSPGFADRIMKEHEDRIKLYPSFDFNEQASAEVRKLYGAIKYFENRYWGNFSQYIRLATTKGRSIDHFQNDLWQLCGTANKPSPLLDKYIFLLERPDQDLKAIAIAEQKCIKEVAFFLNDIIALYRRSILEVPPTEGALEAYNYLNQMVFNFRLTDIKKY